MEHEAIDKSTIKIQHCVCLCVCVCVKQSESQSHSLIKQNTQQFEFTASISISVSVLLISLECALETFERTQTHRHIHRKHWTGIQLTSGVIKRPGLRFLG